MKFYKLFALMVLTFSLGMFITACTEDNSTNVTPPKPEPVTNLMATSINDSTVKITFTKSTTESNSLFKHYLLTVFENSVQTTTDSILNAGTTSFTITKLTEGKIYNFQIVAKYTNDSVSTPAIVKWSPASRFDQTDAGDIIKVYETSSKFGSGLQIFNSNIKKSKVQTIDSCNLWDLGLYTKNDSVIFGSATQLNYNYTSTPKVTQMLSDYFQADALNDVLDNKALNAGDRESKFDDIAFDFTGINPTKNTVFYIRKIYNSNKYNYAKIMLLKNPSGAGYLQGSSPNRFIEVQISFQKTADVPYAKVANNNDTK